MKTSTGILLISFYFISHIQTLAQAQGGAFVDLCIGYGLPAGCDEINSSYFSDSVYNFTDEGVYGSYGSGIAPAITGGYWVCKNVAAQLRLSYIRGKEYKYDDIENNFGAHFTSHSEERAFGIYLEPMLNFSSERENKKLSFFARVGAIIPLTVANKITTDANSDNGFSIAVFHQVEKQKGDIYIGYTGAVGGMYQMAEHVGILGEVYYRGLAVGWKSAKLTEYTSTLTYGNIITITNLDDLDVSEKEIEYVEKITSEDNTSPDQPARVLEDFVPFSSVGISIGVRLLF